MKEGRMEERRMEGWRKKGGKDGRKEGRKEGRDDGEKKDKGGKEVRRLYVFS